VVTHRVTPYSRSDRKDRAGMYAIFPGSTVGR